MFCNKCGTQIIDGEGFCRSCGARVKPVTSSFGGQAPVTPVQQPNYNYQQPQSYNQPYAQQPYAQQPYMQGNPYMQNPQFGGYHYAPLPEGSAGAKAHVSFGEAIRLFFKNYTNFSGRSVPGEYWYIVLFNIIIVGPLGFLAGLTSLVLPVISILCYVLLTPYFLLTFIPSLAVTIRRYHDTGRSGWCYFIFLVPFVGWIFNLVWLIEGSNQNDNQYGPAPRQF